MLDTSEKKCQQQAYFYFRKSCWPNKIQTSTETEKVWERQRERVREGDGGK